MRFLKKRKYLPEFVFGGIDGNITTFAIVTGATGASLSAGVILVLGIANLVADGFSMGVSHYLSTKSQTELHRGHRDYKIFLREGKHPAKIGFATFISFFIIGIIPLSSYILAYFIPSLIPHQLNLSIIFAGIAFLTVGGIKGIITKIHPIRSSLETLFIGGIAAGVAYYIGFILRNLVGPHLA